MSERTKLNCGLPTYLRYLSGHQKVSLRYSHSSKQHAQVDLLYLATSLMQLKGTKYSQQRYLLGFNNVLDSPGRVI